MNYLLKFQSSPGIVVDFFLNKSKRNCKIYKFYEHYYINSSVLAHNVQEFSSYVSALKTLPEKKKRNKKSSLLQFDSEKLKNKDLFDHKIGNKKKSVSKKAAISFIQSETSQFNHSNCSSFEPNLFIHHDKLHSELCTTKKSKKRKKLDVKKSSVVNINTDVFKILNVNKVKKVDLTKSEKRLVDANDKKDFSADIKEDEYLYLMDENTLISTLHSSIDIFLTNDRIKDGIELLKGYRHKVIWKQSLKKDRGNIALVYNTILHCLAKKGEWEILQEVKNWMITDGLKLNSESFAAVLYCLAKVREIRKDVKVVESNKVIKELFACGISLNDLFTRTSLTKDKSEKILEIIREVVPYFDIKPSILKLNSDCGLLQNLYANPSKLQSPIAELGIDALESLIHEQISNEKNCLFHVKAVMKSPLTVDSPKLKETVTKLKKKWRENLANAVTNFIETAKIKYMNSPDLTNIYIYLTSVPKETIVNNLMEFTENLVEFSGGYSPSTMQLRNAIGTRLAQAYLLRKKELTGVSDRTEKLFKEYASWLLDPQGPARNSRQKWQMLIEDTETTSQLDCKVVRWPNEVTSKLGKCLFDMIIKETKITSVKNNQEISNPVFYTVFRYHSNAWREEIKCHPSVSQLFAKVGSDTLTFQADQIPMVCPPKPWKSVGHGGYLLLNTDFVRKVFCTQGKTLNFQHIPSSQLYAAFDALNVLQSVQWVINENVLDVALEVFKNGGSEKLNVPHYPEPLNNEFKITEDMSLEEKMKVLKEKKSLMQEKHDEYGLWCEALYRLSVANHFRKRHFWLPQNCDFRGRVYPVPPLLNHIGSDLYRSLLLFAKGKPLGPNGFDWIKIHLINLTGTHKKKTIRERLEYANKILPEILDSAEKPLTGNRWWTKSEEPWQTLSACMEIKKIISSPCPENYISGFPIHQDGSCNGLQHYAALGKDLIGAQSVNLASLQTPQDVYLAVANLIEEERQKDEANGVEIAKILNGFIERKVIKQTVMTTVYGVTSYGAKLQIKKRLKEMANFPPEYIQPAAVYLSDKTFYCLKKMFTSAREIQDWFTNCAKAITSVNDYVQWTTPLGLPVLQPYGKYRTSRVSKRKIVVPNSVKQKNAFPPNFIHSLDSSHMMLTALFCEQSGITFAAVHDCFWTHPCCVEIMNRICREQFVALHSEPVLEELSRFFLKNYPHHENSGLKLCDIFAAVPAKGEFDLNNVSDSVYFFS